jgi:hypothetical protein
LQGVVADHARGPTGLAEMMGEMRLIVENAKREAGAATDVIARIEAASQALAQVQKQAEDYLNEVTRVLAASHERYATSLSSILQDQYKAFYTRLSDATGLLRTAIQELGLTVQAVVKKAVGSSGAPPLRQTRQQGRGGEAVLDLLLRPHDRANGLVPGRHVGRDDDRHLQRRGRRAAEAGTPTEDARP